MKIYRLLGNPLAGTSLVNNICGRCLASVKSNKYLSTQVAPQELENNSPQPSKGKKWVNVKELFDARVHLGHREGSLDPRMSPYVWGSRLGHLIIDLDVTVRCLNRALDVTQAVAQRKGIVLLVSGVSAGAAPAVEEAAMHAGEYAHTRPWRLGTLTNATMLFGAVTRLPDLIISIGSHTALTEAAKMAIPTIAILDTDCNPSIVTYPVPGNDDSPSALHLYLSLFTQAILSGKELASATTPNS